MTFRPGAIHYKLTEEILDLELTLVVARQYSLWARASGWPWVETPLLEGEKRVARTLSCSLGASSVAVETKFPDSRPWLPDGTSGLTQAHRNLAILKGSTQAWLNLPPADCKALGP